MISENRNVSPDIATGTSLLSAVETTKPIGMDDG